MTSHVGSDQDQMTSCLMASSLRHQVPDYVMPRHLVGSNVVIINLQTTSRLPLGFTQSGTQGDLKDKIRKPFCVRVGSIHLNHDVTNISQITSDITFPVSKSKHVSEIALKREYAAAANALLSQITLTCQPVAT